VHNLKSVACTRIITLSLGCTHRCSKRQAPNSSKAIDADFHDASLKRRDREDLTRLFRTGC
jgi:hypothetical protein